MKDRVVIAAQLMGPIMAHILNHMDDDLERARKKAAEEAVLAADALMDVASGAFCDR